MLLGVDLGTRNTGLAISSGSIASPYKTITHKSLSEAVEKISSICTEEQIKVLVIGFVEGKIKSYFDEFTKRFQEKNLQIKIVARDETLTSNEANSGMIALNIPVGKRREKEHEVAASLILQSYLNESND